MFSIHCQTCGGFTRKKERKENLMFKCPNCGTIYYPKPAPAVAGIIIKSGKLLLVKRNIEPGKGKWALPSGFINYGEEPLKALKREMKEELGIDIQEAALFTAKIGKAHKDKLVLGLFYLVNSHRGRIRLSGENSDANWFTLSSLTKIAFRDNLQAIREYIKQSKE